MNKLNGLTHMLVMWTRWGYLKKSFCHVYAILETLVECVFTVVTERVCIAWVQREGEPFIVTASTWMNEYLGICQHINVHTYLYPKILTIVEVWYLKSWDRNWFSFSLQIHDLSRDKNISNVFPQSHVMQSN